MWWNKSHSQEVYQEEALVLDRQAPGGVWRDQMCYWKIHSISLSRPQWYFWDIYRGIKSTNWCSNHVERLAFGLFQSQTKCITDQVHILIWKGKRSMKWSLQVFCNNSLLFDDLWLSLYPKAPFIIYDNGIEFKLYIEVLSNSYSLVHKPTLMKKRHANCMPECTHCWLRYDKQLQSRHARHRTKEDVADFITSATWAICMRHLQYKPYGAKLYAQSSHIW